LLGPSENGFIGMCSESYETKVSVKAYKMTLFGWTVIDKKEFYNGALEFGGEYLCKTNNPCK
jgi:hypothetical protein